MTKKFIFLLFSTKVFMVKIVWKVLIFCFFTEDKTFHKALKQQKRKITEEKTIKRQNYVNKYLERRKRSESFETD